MIVVYTQDTSIGEMEGEKERESYWWKPEVVPIYFTRKNTSIKKLCQQKYERIVHEIARRFGDSKEKAKKLLVTG